MHSQSLKNALKLAWCPLCMIMTSAPGLKLHSRVDDITDSDVSSSYTIATEYLNENYSYLFTDGKEVHMLTCLIDTWSHKLLHSEVKNNGMIADKAKQPKKMNNKKGPQRSVRRGPQRSMLERQRSGHKGLGVHLNLKRIYSKIANFDILCAFM